VQECAGSVLQSLGAIAESYGEDEMKRKKEKEKKERKRRQPGESGCSCLLSRDTDRNETFDERR
jgi:hypothetical protein